MVRRWRIPVGLLLACMVTTAPPAAAQQQQAPAAPQAQPAIIAPQAQTPALPDQIKLNLLIRTSIIALNQANQTGNYTVLRDLGAPAFRAANDSARLAQIFAALRQRQLDLAPVLFFTPKLLAQPQIAPNGLLRLTGFFPTTPERVNFDLIFQPIEGQWSLFGIGVSTSPAEVTAAVPPAAGAGQAANTPPAGATQQGKPAPAAKKAAAPAPAAQPKAAQKPETAPPPSRKQDGSKSEQPKAPEKGATGTVIQNGTTNNVARIDLATPDAAPGAQPEEAATGAATGSSTKQPGFWDSFTVFGTD